MKKVKKGTRGYIRYEQKKRALVTFVLFAIPLTIYVTGYLQTRTRLNLFTFVAILGCLPACKSLVGLMMMLMQKPMPAARYEEAAKAAGSLVAGYEMIFTTYEHTTPVSALIVCGNHIVCFTEDEKTAPAQLEKHIAKTLAVSGFHEIQVRVMKEWKPFLQRVSEICSRQEHFREGFTFQPDERYPSLSGEELIFHTLLAVCL